MLDEVKEVDSDLSNCTDAIFWNVGMPVVRTLL